MRAAVEPGDPVTFRTKRLITTSKLPTLKYAIENVYPHDPAAFTQGLFYDDGHLFESTGWWGQSTVRKVRIEDGQVITGAALPSNCFGEGLVRWGNEIVSVTWRNGMGFRFDLETFREKSRFQYHGEAWGLTRNENEIVMTDGSSQLHFLDPLTMRRSRSIKVTANDLPVRGLNDIEWVDGEVWANVWQTDLIARIEGVTGVVAGWLDLSALRSLVGASGENDVLNGIAYAPDDSCFFVTGKKWPKIFRVRLTGEANGKVNSTRLA